MKTGQDVDIRLGEGCEIDDHVILGYKTKRKADTSFLEIGAGSGIRSGSVIYAGTKTGKNFQTGHNVVVREQNIVGDDVCLWSNSVIDYGCRIGNRVKIHTNVYIAQNTVIEDDVFIAPGTSFANDKYPLSPLLEGPVIKQGARIGVNVTVLPGVTVGRNAMVGAGSVVTKDVADDAVVCGNPARVVSHADEIEQKRKKHLEKNQ